MSVCMEQAHGDKWYSLGDNAPKWGMVKGLVAEAENAAGHAPSGCHMMLSRPGTLSQDMRNDGIQQHIHNYTLPLLGYKHASLAC